ncbi:hypothetical protein Scep_030861 [Stephania cephalantha]|uniref:Uncharacterized protein n=1 Tax=Stephania cephalantha TaxID=152367 RepID=A0AAP0HIZ9_9MAGN
MTEANLFAEMGVQVTIEDFMLFIGMRHERLQYTEALKIRFFEIYPEKAGELELVSECKRSSLKVVVASSADQIKVNANLAAAGTPISIFVNGADKMRSDFPNESRIFGDLCR